MNWGGFVPTLPSWHGSTAKISSAYESLQQHFLNYNWSAELPADWLPRNSLHVWMQPDWLVWCGHYDDVLWEKRQRRKKDTWSINRKHDIKTQKLTYIFYITQHKMTWIRGVCVFVCVNQHHNSENTVFIYSGLSLRMHTWWTPLSGGFIPAHLHFQSYPVT